MKVQSVLLAVSLFFSLYSYADEVVYGQVETRENRAKDSRYTPFKEFKEVTLVREGEILSASDVLDPSLWDPSIKLDNMNNLYVKGLDLMLDTVRDATSTRYVPFALTVRFEEKNETLAGTRIESWNPYQGTLNVEGDLAVTVESGAVTNVQLLRYDLSSVLERSGRLMGLIDKYDGNFLEGIVPPVLMDFFSNAENRQALAKTLGISVKGPANLKQQTMP